MKLHAEYLMLFIYVCDVCVCCCADTMDGCSTDCNGNGECVAGHCHCFAGFLGPDCAKGKKCVDEIIFSSCQEHLKDTMCWGVSPVSVY